MNKLNSFLRKLFNPIFVLLILIIAFQLGMQTLNAATMTKSEDIIFEELRLNVPIKYKKAWINAEMEIWEPWLSKQKGFLGRQIFYNQKKGEALVLVKWENKELWKNISDEEVNKIQNDFEKNVKDFLAVDTNPFDLVYEGELFKQK